MHKYFSDITEAYRKYTGKNPDFSIPLPPTASNRQYFRLSSGEQTLIACYNPDKAENEAFFYIQKKLTEAGVRVPEIYYTDPERLFYLQEDLGDVKLFDLVENYRKNHREDFLAWYKLVIDQMPAIQYKTAQDFDFSHCYPRAAFDRQSVIWDLNYFKYYFLKLQYVPFHEQKLENDFQVLADFLEEAASDFFLFRDFQSRNIMIHKDEVVFIDFQGGRRGSLQYDPASLLFEAKAGLTAEQRNTLLAYYLDVFSAYDFFNRDEFLRYFPAFCLIRILQAFGAYGYRGYFEKKSLFIQSIPPAMENLKWILANFDLSVQIPQLKTCLNNMTAGFKYDAGLQSPGNLLIRIHSFAYKNGIPPDYSGHGGGFVFDCRSLPNPGRHEAYKDMTGKDKAVIDFLQEKKEVQNFVRNTTELVSAAVENYRNRGHEHLMVSYGCTGGQHRSVYCAEQLYRYLSQKFDVKLSIQHSELED